METMSLTTLSDTILPVLLPYLPIIAKGAAEKLGGDLPAAVSKLWSTIRNRMNTKGVPNVSIQDILNNPKNEKFQIIFKAQLEKVIAQDQSFRQQLLDLLGKVDLKDKDGYSQGSSASKVGKHGVMIENSIIINGDNNRVSSNK